MSAGSITTVFVLVGWAQVRTLTGFYAVLVVAGLAMAATLYEPAFATIVAWFEGRQADAILALTVCAGFASVVFLPLTSLLISALGWRGALYALAVTVAAICLPLHALVLRRRPSDMGLVPDGNSAKRAGDKSADPVPSPMTVKAALASSSFRWLTLSLVLATVGRLAISVMLIAYLSGRGYGLQAASFAAGGIGVFQIVGRITARMLRGCLSDQFVYPAILGVQGLSVCLLLLTTGHDAGATRAVVTFVGLYGLGFGIPELLRGVLVPEYYGVATFANINGILGFFITGARATAPIAAGIITTAISNYTPVLVGGGLLAIGSAAFLIVAQAAHTREARQRLPSSSWV
jgi:hypothetical protein